MKPRADSFLYAAEHKDLMVIQGEVQRHCKTIEENNTIDEIEKANQILHLYTAVAFDEGYRKAIKELKEGVKSFLPIKKRLKKHKKNWLEYSNKEEILKLTPLIKKRIDSKRMLSRHKKIKGSDFEYDNFVLSMAIHTGFEHGYIKGSSIEENAKWVFESQERADMVVDLFYELFNKHMVE